jgi:serine/threonine protein kinase
VLDPEKIGSGGFADVFRASDMLEPESAANPVVAVKVLRDLKSLEIRRRFERELRLVRQCRHPNIVPILDAGEDENGTIWYAMPLAKGSLADEADRFIGKDDDVLHIMRQLCDGMAYVHKIGIYHRDLKPANVLRMATEAWAISDFGLAREAERTTTALTSTLRGVGTYFYAAPEAWKGAKYAEAPADIYGLGKILHQLVTGDLPVDSEDVDSRFRSVIRKATRPHANDRYQSATEMLEALHIAATAQDRWENLSDITETLTERLSANVADDSALDDLMEMLQGKSEGIVELRETIPSMSKPALERLWEQNTDGYRYLIHRYAEHVGASSWSFGFCDTIADFFDRAVTISGDDDVLGDSLLALVEMGASHNRYYVRDVVTDVLQRIRTPDAAMSAADALKASSRFAITWTVSEFVARSLHPIVRAIVDDAHKQESN